MFYKYEVYKNCNTRISDNLFTTQSSMRLRFAHVSSISDFHTAANLVYSNEQVLASECGQEGKARGSCSVVGIPRIVQAVKTISR
jgi:hypothetical protein